MGFTPCRRLLAPGLLLRTQPLPHSNGSLTLCPSLNLGVTASLGIKLPLPHLHCRPYRTHACSQALPSFLSPDAAPNRRRQWSPAFALPRNCQDAQGRPCVRTAHSSPPPRPHWPDVFIQHWPQFPPLSNGHPDSTTLQGVGGSREMETERASDAPLLIITAHVSL